MKEALINHAKAGFGIIAVSSSEETRTLDVIRQSSQALDRKMYIWSLTRGMVDMQNGHSDGEMRDPIAFLQFIASGNEEKIGVLLDPEPFIGNPEFKRSLKDNIADFRSSKMLILLGVGLKIQTDIAHLVTNLENKLPGRDVLGHVIDDIASSSKIEVDDDDKDKAITALSGLTTDEAADAVALSIVESKKIDPLVISREKCYNISRQEYIKVIDRDKLPTMDDVGGLENLKNWIRPRARIFTKEARQFGLPTPKGFLMTGVPGCGKSLVAKVTAGYFGIPLIRMDFGALMNQFVGNSESNARNSIEIAESMAPCLFWWDEIDNGIGSGAGQDGHEVTGRIIGTFLTWLQEKDVPVFVIATANNIAALAKSKPELLRKGRWDEVFFVDLPNAAEREAIFKIHIKKFRPNLSHPVDSFVPATDGFSGAEIEAVVSDAMFRAFSANDDLSSNHIHEAILATVPMSRFAKDNIQSLRDWCKDRTVPASIADKQESNRKIKM